MSTGTLIIRRALQKIGASSSVSEPDPDTVQTAFEALNSMIADWTARGIDINAVPLTVPGDDLGELPDTTNAVISNLAVLVSPDMDNGKGVVSQVLMSQSTSQFQMVKNKYQTVAVPCKVISSTTPRGAGNRLWRFGEAYFPEGSEIGN